MTVSKELLHEVLEAVSHWEGTNKKEAETIMRQYFPLKSYLNKKEVAEMLNCSTRQVDYLRENYSLPWTRLGEVIRFNVNDLQAWLEAQKQTGPGCVPSLAKQETETE